MTDISSTLPQEEAQEKKYTKILETYDVIIIGGGVAGLSAGIYTARDGMKTLILEGEFLSNTEMPGGALLLTSEIENFPGFLHGEGAELISIIHTQATNFGADIITARAESVSLSKENCGWHEVVSSDGKTYRSKAIILTTGAVARWLNVPGEAEFYGRGVSSCATCDGDFFRDGTVAVIGGGDTAVEDAIYLSNLAKKVYLLPRKNDLKAKGPQARQAILLDEDPDSNFSILWSSQVESINSLDNKVNGLTYKDANGELANLDLDGVFVAIGRDPATSFLAGSDVQFDAEGYIMTEPESTKVLGDTVGVYAAGDAVDKVFRQAITSAGRAVEAALEARHYLLTAKRN
jgi:thioredoxin reductase (NADPH)